MNFGFIGAGNMASAIIKGMTIGTKSYDPTSIFVTSITMTSAKNLETLCGVVSLPTTKEVIEKSDILILGVKPHVLAEILPDLKQTIQEKGCVVVSIAAGKSLSYLAELLGANVPILRIMPNINAKIGAATSGLCYNQNVTPVQKEKVTAIFSTIGSVIDVPENHFGIFTVLAGSAPAFAYLYMNALATAGVKAGLPKEQALEIVAQTVLGSAKMVLESKEHPWALIDQVCSPGGTTIEGVASLEANGFEATLTKAFDAVLEKDKRM